MHGVNLKAVDKSTVIADWCSLSVLDRADRLKSRMKVEGLKPGMVLHTCSPGTGEQRQEDQKFQDSLD